MLELGAPLVGPLLNAPLSPPTNPRAQGLAPSSRVARAHRSGLARVPWLRGYGTRVGGHPSGYDPNAANHCSRACLESSQRVLDITRRFTTRLVTITTSDGNYAGAPIRQARQRLDARNPARSRRPARAPRLGGNNDLQRPGSRCSARARLQPDGREDPQLLRQFAGPTGSQRQLRWAQANTSRAPGPREMGRTAQPGAERYSRDAQLRAL